MPVKRFSGFFFKSSGGPIFIFFLLFAGLTDRIGGEPGQWRGESKGTIMSEKIEQVQQYLRQHNLSGWLLYDFRGINPIAVEFLGIQGIQTRRWFYYLPAAGIPTAIIHKIEEHNFDSIVGNKIRFIGWQELHHHLANTLKGAKRVAMEYSPLNAIPYIARVDAGTIELIRGLGVEVVSSADLVQNFQARLTSEQYGSHCEAATALMAIKDSAFAQAAQAARGGLKLSEYELQQYIWNLYDRFGLTSDARPIVAVNANAGNPHYEPTENKSTPIRKGELVLLDLWAKKKTPGAVYADITWVGFLSDRVPEKYEAVFQIVREARDRAIDFVKTHFGKSEPLYGWQVDEVCRDFIKEKGYADFFTHRTGHSIATEDHGNGVNIDNLETQDTRQIIPGVCFSIEPGIYLADFGVRSEINIYVEDQGPRVTTLPLQTEILPLLK